MEAILNQLNAILWGPPTMILLLVVGIYFSFKTGFFQITKIGYILKNTLGKIFKREAGGGDSEGTMTPFQAVSTALAGTVGNANMAGVAAAIVIGGPGAVFWMWVIACFGMLTKLVEVALAVHYRQKAEDGTFFGGPMYYIEYGLGKKWKPMAMFFSLMMMLGALGTAVFVQPATMSAAMDNIFSIPPVVTVVA
ncbi:MAG: alanine:cation symporter family protein, partial [Oscillospiraceae bacterium]